MTTAPKLRRGFNAMDRERAIEISRLGGIAAHMKGTAHEWDHAEAVEAGRKGGAASRGGRGKVVDARST